MNNTLNNKKIGLAIDLGTNELHFAFYNLKTHKLISTVIKENYQMPYGDDLNSRLKYFSIEPDKTLLNEILITQINEEIKSFCDENEISSEMIERIVIVGNTPMEHFASGIDMSEMTEFEALTLFGIEDRARDMGIKSSPSAVVYIAPCVNEQVGGDVISGMLACNMDKSAKNILYIDFGTSVELAVKAGNKFFCSSCENTSRLGGGISFGKPLKSGDIKSVCDNNGKITAEVYNGITPTGFSASGLIDATATALDLQLIDNKGKIKNSDRIYITEEVFLTQKDLREIQISKSSIAAAIVTLIEVSGITLNDIEKVIFAGNTDFDMNSAVRIGMFPPHLINIIKEMGNTAISGAVRMLLTPENQDRAQYLADKCIYIKLSETPFFGGEYVSQMMF